MPRNIKIFPIEPYGKVILILEGEFVPAEAERLAKDVHEFLVDTEQRVLVLHGWPIKLVKAENVKEIRVEEKQ